MRFWSGSLVARLLRRLILLQVVALVLVVIVASIPERGRSDVAQLDDEVLDRIATVLARDGDRLVFRGAAELDAIAVGHPGFWVLARDGEGRMAEFGPIPELVRLVLAGDPLQAEVYGADGGSLIARQMESAAGPVALATGGGPTLEPVAGQLRRIEPLSLLGLAALTTLLALAIAWLLRRDLSGISRMAKEAALIDVDRPSARLTEADIPRELHVMAHAMNAALARLEEGQTRRKRFLATAAHELRTPVSILSLRIESLPPGPERSRLLLDVARLGSLADQLLDLERLDGETLPFARLNLSTTVGAAVADIAPLAVAAGAGLSFEAPEGPVEIMGDGPSIRRVATNLVQNALAHGGEGVAIAVEIALPAELRVRDDGPGIAASDREQIFEPFVRRSGVAGSGLGLHLVREIVTRHGGSIEAGEAPGGGAEFIVRFPPAAPL
ncbi:MAG: HAMP domain-containing histidine kinase [Bauldia sp.]|nr:HAMP domain-containing histidine kinase [Bauldia sp.]